MTVFHDIAPGLEGLFRTVLQASWQGALTIGLVLIVRRALGTRMPARWHYLLWFLVLARLLVPTGVLPHSPASLGNIPVVAYLFASRGPVSPNVVPPVSPDSVTIPKSVSAPTMAAKVVRTPAASATVAWSPRAGWVWAAWIWLGGAALLASWLMTCAMNLRQRLHRETFPVEEDVLAVWCLCCRRWLGQAPPRLLAADWVGSPALVGWWRPTLLIPHRSLKTFSTCDWEHVFAHEIAHLRWRDHWTQLLLLAAGCVHWFNPVVWLGLRRLRTDRELAADEWVLRHLGDERALAYGETLFKTVAERSIHPAFLPGMIGISEDGAQMKQRLRRIAAFLPQHRLLGSLAGLTAVLGLATVVLGQGTADQKDKTSAKASSAPRTALTISTWPQTAQSLRAGLLAAARAADAKRMDALFNSGDPKLRARCGPVALSLLDGLLQQGDTLAFTTLYDALQRLPLDRGDWKPSEALLISLVKAGRTDSLDALMARGLDLKRLDEPAKLADAPTSEWIKRRVAKVTSERADIDTLENAAGDGDLDTLRRLLDAGLDVNVVGPDHNTPLLRAVFGNRLEAAQLLLDRGAQVDKPRFPGWDYTPLCLVNSVAMAELLKKNGANVHAKLFSREVSILSYVKNHASSEVVQWFLQQGLDPKMVEDRQRNLLFGLKDERTAKLLLDAGADPNQVDDSGNPPICYARSGAVAQALIEHGAKVTGFQRPLLPNMVSYGRAPADALAVALKAGADHDPATLQDALGRNDRFGEEGTSEKEKVRQLLLGAGAQPTPASEAVRPSRHHGVRVSAADGTLLGEDSTQVHVVQTFDPVGSGGVSTSSETARVESDGTAPVWIDEAASTAVLAATSDGFATAYAEPFTPPTKEKLDGVRFTLKRGFQASVQTVDEAGQPIPNAKLTAYYPGPPKLDLGAAVTDAFGKAVFDHIGSAPLTAQARADGYEADTLTAIDLHPGQTYRWTLKKASALPGLVTASATGQPIVAAKIKLAGVRGPHDETHADPEAAPLLAISDAQGRFALTSLRPDSVYDLYVEAPGHGGILLNKIKASQAELKVALGPEISVRGKIVHLTAGQRGENLGYSQPFEIGGSFYEEGKSRSLEVVNGEAEFALHSLYDNDVNVVTGGGQARLKAKDLPKSDLIIDAAQKSVSSTPAPTVTPTPVPSPTPAPTPVGVATARVINT